MTAAATVLKADDDEGGHDDDRGDPRGEARSPDVDLSRASVVGCGTELLLLMSRLDVGMPEWLLRGNARAGAQLLSSYNNNSNNPRRGTDRLRGAW